MSDAGRQRLTAILAADGVGYSLLMAQNPNGTLVSLDAARGAFRTAISKHGGRVVDMAGDSVLAVFDSAAGAMRSAFESQQAIEALTARQPEESRLRFRIGLHLGDVLEKDDGTVYGDGVNIASRLQALAHPGGIVTSDAFRGAVRSVDARFNSLGDQLVKNIVEPIRAFRVDTRSGSSKSDAYAGHSTSKLRRRIFASSVALLVTLVAIFGLTGTLLPAGEDRPWSAAPSKSIAVMPFVNVSADKEQEYFSNELADELIDRLAKLPDINVIARSSSFAFKNGSESSKVIARKLNVANILEGSIRRSGNRLRITTALVRGKTGQTVWSETYDREMQDVFKVQDEIAQAVIASLKVKLISTDIATHQRTENVDAYVQFLLGREYRSQSNVAGYRAAASAYRRAIALDPRYAAAYAGLSICEFQIADESNDPAAFARSKAAADKAVELEPTGADGYFSRGYYLYRREWDWAGALADFEKALLLNPGDGPLRREYGLLLLTIGRIEEAISAEKRASALDPLSGDAWAYLARMYFAAGSPAEGHGAASRAIELQPSSSRALTISGISHLLQGRALEAQMKFEKIDDAGVRLTGRAMVEHTLWLAEQSSQSIEAAIAQAGSDSAFQIAEAFTWRGEKDQAFKWIERSIDQRDPGITLFKVDALLEPLRKDSRYQELLKRLNLAVAR